MRILVLPDIHDRLDRVEKILKEATNHHIEAILCVGDISSQLRPKTAITPELLAKTEKVKNGLIARINKLLPLPFYYVPGNHDAPTLGLTQTEAENYQSDGYNTDSKVSHLNKNVTVYGIGGSPVFYGWPYEWNEADLEAHLKTHYPWKNPPHIILSHTPPASCPVAMTKHGQDAGSTTIADLAKQHRGLLLCGHIHEAYGVEKINECVVVNAGALGTSHGACRLVYLDYNPNSRKVSEVEMREI